MKKSFVQALMILSFLTPLTSAAYICECYRTWSNYPVYQYFGMVEGDSFSKAQYQCKILTGVDGIAVIANCR